MLNTQTCVCVCVYSPADVLGNTGNGCSFVSWQRTDIHLWNVSENAGQDVALGRSGFGLWLWLRADRGAVVITTPLRRRGRRELFTFLVFDLLLGVRFSFRFELVILSSWDFGLNKGAIKVITLQLQLHHCTHIMRIIRDTKLRQLRSNDSSAKCNTCPVIWYNVHKFPFTPPCR